MVADLLNRSRAAHAQFHAGNRWDGHTWTAGDVQAARAALVEARTLRLDADAADPGHADPAWQADRAPHGALLTFYDGYLARHP